MQGPREAPENLPSVTIAVVEANSGIPISASVVMNISGMPEPFGPSYRITMTAPGDTFPCAMASCASSSRSNTAAGPM